MDDLIARLEAENDDLRDRVRALEGVLFGESWRSPVEFGLTGTEARILGMLVEHGRMTKAVLMFGLYEDRIDGGPEPKILDVLVCKIRAKLKPFGLSVMTHWGEGYGLDDEARAALKHWNDEVAA